MNLYNLAKIILIIERNGLSKVRFAKTIYFVHKELIRQGMLPSAYLDYVRMPLGPVPNGFMELANSHNDILTELVHTGLSYNSINYRLKRRPFLARRKNPLYNQIEDILHGLHSVSTRDLIELSHKDASWLTHENGQLYTITDRDLRNPMPVQIENRVGVNDNQQIQASLVKGMIDDIVSESTALEYPTNADK